MSDPQKTERGGKKTGLWHAKEVETERTTTTTPFCGLITYLTLSSYVPVCVAYTKTGEGQKWSLLC